eukprot:1855434-Amphidinium_carterae.1
MPPSFTGRQASLLAAAFVARVSAATNGYMFTVLFEPESVLTTCIGTPGCQVPVSFRTASRLEMRVDTFLSDQATAGLPNLQCCLGGFSQSANTPTLHELTIRAFAESPPPAGFLQGFLGALRVSSLYNLQASSQPWPSRGCGA